MTKWMTIILVCNIMKPLCVKEKCVYILESVNNKY